jgi:hypothetical protein
MFILWDFKFSRRWVWCSELSSGILCTASSLMMEAVRTSETSVDNHFTRQYIPEDNSEHQMIILFSQSLHYFFFLCSLTFKNGRAAVGFSTWKAENTPVLQQQGITHCHNSTQHIRLGWQTCRISDGTHKKCNESKNVRHHEHKYVLNTLTVRNFYVSHSGRPPMKFFCNIIVKILLW